MIKFVNNIFQDFHQKFSTDFKHFWNSKLMKLTGLLADVGACSWAWQRYARQRNWLDGGVFTKNILIQSSMTSSRPYCSESNQSQINCAHQITNPLHIQKFSPQQLPFKWFLIPYIGCAKVIKLEKNLLNILKNKVMQWH